MKTVNFVCDRNIFRDADSSGVRWLDWETDFEMARRFWPREYPLTREIWDEARELGYRYCAIVDAEQIAAIAAEYRFSDEAWMLAAVRTAERCRRQGLGKKVCAFVTAHILECGRLATCWTDEGNVAMICTARGIGFKICDSAAVMD